VIDELRRAAAEQEVGATQLAREWIVERLAVEREAEASTSSGMKGREALGVSKRELAAALRPLLHDMVAEELAKSRARRGDR
jgi:hypothetical protein